ncbi:MAG: hypothetical protein N2170_07860 [Bacteroidia bacterium]|nr:hypothetical protein [Bacteroidia bacterium]
MKKYLLVSFVSAFLGCQRTPQEPVIAQYRDRYLTYSEALSRVVIPEGTDTATLLRSYGMEWIKQQALAETAYTLLPQLRAQIESQVQDYRTKLLIAYLSRLLAEKAVSQHLPPDSLLQRQYEAQPEAFRALQPFYRYRWVKLPDTWFARRELSQKLYEADSFWSRWLTERNYTGGVVPTWTPRSGLDSLQMFFSTPLSGLSLRSIAQSSRVEGGQAYLLVFQLTGLILPGQILPFELVREQIIDILLQQQVHDWLSAFEDSVYRRALARPDVRLY